MKVKYYYLPAIILSLIVWSSFYTPALGEEKEAVFVDLSDFSGPASPVSVPTSRGIQDYFKHVNEKGGVDGIKLKYIGVDTRYDNARIFSAYQRHVKTKNVLGFCITSSGAATILLPLAQKNKVVILSPPSGLLHHKLRLLDER